MSRGAVVRSDALREVEALEAGQRVLLEDPLEGPVPATLVRFLWRHDATGTETWTIRFDGRPESEWPYRDRPITPPFRVLD